ncbi:MAG TPA: flagellar hook capping FlgD N-terminal domain-containing protein [Bryobacteraceae bacterium]|nr:flagellar hook capping FlgD N-terminal domain-containing protein [Bryobacteraceae bacterium]
MAAIASAVHSAITPHVAHTANSTNTNNTNSTNSSSSDDSSSTSDSIANDALANEQTFLQLLVSQLKNQDPTSPMDGTQFVTQLAQFSQLEQDLAMRKDLDKIAGVITTTGGATGVTGNGTQQ